MRVLPLAAAAALLLVAGHAAAETTVLTESATYTMGDGDTRAAARQSCVGRAQAAAVQKSGMLVTTEVDTSTVEASTSAATSAAASRTRASAAGIVKSETENESTAIEPDGRLVVSCTVRVTLDPAEVERATAAGARDADRIREAETRIATLETERRTNMARIERLEQAPVAPSLLAAPPAGPQLMVPQPPPPVVMTPSYSPPAAARTAAYVPPPPPAIWSGPVAYAPPQVAYVPPLVMARLAPAYPAPPTGRPQPNGGRPQPSPYVRDGQWYCGCTGTPRH